MRICEKKVKVAGHIMSKNGIFLDPAKITSINNMSPPNTITEVKSFMGAVNFYRKFIRNCASISEPLIQLTQGKSGIKKPFVWSAQQQESFKILKSLLVSSKILKFMDIKKSLF